MADYLAISWGDSGALPKEYGGTGFLVANGAVGCLGPTFHKVRYYGLWHPSKRDQSHRAWALLILATPVDPARPPKVTSLSEVLSQLMELTDQALNKVLDHDAKLPRCPHCGSCRTRLLGEYPRLGGRNSDGT
jgi:hypothetical protein